MVWSSWRGKTWEIQEGDCFLMVSERAADEFHAFTHIIS